MKIHKNFLTSILVSVALTVLLVGILAFLIKIFALSNSTITFINQVIKVIACVLGLSIFIKSKGIIWGMVYGAIYSLICGLIFMIIGKDAPTLLSFVLDIVFCAVIGGIAGIMVANLKAPR